jgi:hypothetical protein
MHSSFLVSADITEFHMTEAYSSLHLSNIKCDTKQSGLGKEKVTV